MDLLYETAGYWSRNIFIVGLIAIAWCIFRIIIGTKKAKQAKQAIERSENKRERRSRYSEYRKAEKFKKDTILFIIAFLIVLILTVPDTIDYVLDYKNNDMITEELYVAGEYIPKHERDWVTYRLTDVNGETKKYISRLKYLDMLQMKVGEKYMVTYWKRTRVLYSREEISSGELTSP